MNRNQFILFAFIVVLYVEQYDEIYRLTIDLQDKNAQLEAKKLKIMESELYSQMSNKLWSVKAEYDQVSAKLLEVSQINNQCKIYKNQAEREVYELQRNLEMDREKLSVAEWKLRYAKEQVDKLRVENYEANRLVGELKHKIKNDPRNGCRCLCNPIEVFGYCTRGLYRLATFGVRLFIGSNPILDTMDSIVDLLDPQDRYIAIE